MIYFFYELCSYFAFFTVEFLTTKAAKGFTKDTKAL